MLQLPPDLPVVLLADATVEYGADMLPTARGRPGLDGPPGEISYVIRDPWIGHYFHFVEILLALLALHLAHFARSRIAAIYVRSDTLNNPAQNHAQRHLFDVVCRDTAIIDSLDGQTRHVGCAAVLDRFVPNLEFNKYLEPFLPFAAAPAGLLRQRVRQAVAAARGTLMRPGTRPLALYVHRDPPRTLIHPVRARLFQSLAAHGFDVATVDFARLSWADQVRATGGADLLVGVHGNGLTNLLWLPDNASVLEVFPAGMHHYDYQFLAELAGLEYCGVEGVAHGGFVAREFSRFGPARQGEHLPVAALPWGTIARWLAHATARRARGPAWPSEASQAFVTAPLDLGVAR